MELVKMVLVGKINKEIVAQLHLAGAPAVGLAGDDGGLIEAEKASSDEADLGFVGQVASIDPWVLESLSEFVPVVASVGVGADGQSYNINADAVAGRLAAALGARKAIFLTDVEGIFRDIADPGSLISECRLRDLRALMASGSVGSGMIPKLAGVVDALEAGVGAVHVLDGRIPHSVLIEIFTEGGIGTKITA
jgi:acetylglutamate kinase